VASSSTCSVILLMLVSTVQFLVAMVMQPILLVFVITFARMSASDSFNLTCYNCHDDPDGGSYTYTPYDPDCGHFYYNGNTDERVDAGLTCVTVIENSGYVTRGIYMSPGHADGECYYGSSYTRCHCTGDSCNTASYCEQCRYPKPTPSTTEVTTHPTSKSTIGTTEATSLTTKEPISTTTDDIAITTTNQLEWLKCYNCIDCSSVDESTPVIEDENFITCVTIMVVISKEVDVVRGGSYDEYVDGECVQHSEIFSCWCTSNLCNDKKFGHIQEILD
ncbi:unnamed protein product, partial [Meganyctiphanes norvegica]